MKKDDDEQTTAAAQPAPHISWIVLRPGFWRCWRAIRRFKRFENLVIHHDRWGGFLDTAPPLEKLIGKKAAKQNLWTAIEVQMNKLALLIMYDLQSGQRELHSADYRL